MQTFRDKTEALNYISSMYLSTQTALIEQDRRSLQQEFMDEKINMSKNAHDQIKGYLTIINNLLMGRQVNTEAVQRAFATYVPNSSLFARMTKDVCPAPEHQDICRDFELLRLKLNRMSDYTITAELEQWLERFVGSWPPGLLTIFNFAGIRDPDKTGRNDIFLQSLYDYLYLISRKLHGIPQQSLHLDYLTRMILYVSYNISPNDMELPDFDLDTKAIAPDPYFLLDYSKVEGAQILESLKAPHFVGDLGLKIRADIILQYRIYLYEHPALT